MEKFNFDTLQRPEKVDKEEGRLFVSDFVNKINDLFNKGKDILETSKITAEARALGNWRKEGFDVEEKLNKVNGQIIEVAGPTPDGYDLVNFEKLRKPLYTSNVFPGRPYFRENREDGSTTINYTGKVNFIADATKLPFKNGSIGAVFISCLGGSHLAEMSAKMGSKKFKESAHIKGGYPTKEEKMKAVIIPEEEKNKMNLNGDYDNDRLRQNALKEVFRVLESEGILVWQGGHKNDFDFAKNLGFEVVQMSADDMCSNIFHNLVLKAPEKKQNNLDEEKFNAIFEKAMT